MKNKSVLSLCAILVFSLGSVLYLPAQTQDWQQWGRTPQHSGASPAIGQSPNNKLTSVTFDPFTAQEMAQNGGELLAHYQAPLVDKTQVFLEVKTGTYTGPDTWDTQVWNERAYAWQGNSLVQQWNFQSDWKPEPDGNLSGWEPVFHAALGNGFVFVPGFGGSIYKLNEADGTQVAHYQPFGPTDDPNTFVSGPLTVDRAGNVYYNAIKFDSADPWNADIAGAWLVKVTAQGVAHKVSFRALVPGAPATCDGSPCGRQRPSVNVAPVISPDNKTIYTVSRAHFNSGFAYMVAASASQFSPQWNTSMRGLVGRNVVAYASDLSSSSPAVTPDGSILYGAVGQNGGRGYLLKFDPTGNYLSSYSFGWDETPAIYAHDGTYSVVLKDNHYATGGPYYITQLDSALVPEWRYKSPSGLEWCVNAPAVDATGTVYANSEDGNVYVINQGGTLKGKVFLRLAVGAAYTPIAIGRDGKIYAENDGDMFVVGN